MLVTLDLAYLSFKAQDAEASGDEAASSALSQCCYLFAKGKQIAKSNVQNFVIFYVDLLHEEHVSFFGPYLSARIVRSMCGKVPHKDSEQNASQSTTILSMAQLTPRKHEV